MAAQRVRVAADLRFGGMTRFAPDNDLAADHDVRSITFLARAEAFTISGNVFDLTGFTETAGRLEGAGKVTLDDSTVAFLGPSRRRHAC